MSAVTRPLMARWGVWILLPGLAALLLRACAPESPVATESRLAAALARASGCAEVEAITWERSRGGLLDAVLGRRLLFLGKSRAGGPRDVYRARLRTSVEGVVLATEAVSNLSQTPLGDERDLQYDGRYAAFSTFAGGNQQGVTLLDLSRGSSATGAAGPFARAMGWVRSGELERIGRTHFQLPEGDSRRIRVAGKQLTIEAATGELVALPLSALRDRGSALGVQFSAQPQSSTSATQSAVDLLRELAGPRPVAWLESRVFGWVDELRKPQVPAPLREDTPALRVATPEGSWPPQDIAPLLGEGDGSQTEGRWAVPELPELLGHRRADLFRQTSFRVDPERPYARLHLVALDMRHLELRMEGGYEDPRPKTGPPGAGALPRDSETLSRVVATFNGAFKSVHGDYGMMVDRRLLVPPIPSAATVLTTQGGRVGLGTWPQGSREVPPDIVSFRQNLEPLVADGQVNPTGRALWGEQLLGQGAATVRTALCLAGNGQLYYAFGQELTAPSLARGLVHAGCRYAMHLDMNPGHAGFFYHAISGPERGQAKSAPAFPGLTMPPGRHLYWSPQDFFYLVVRDGRPSADERWNASPGLQPEPEQAPAIFSSQRQHGDLSVRLTRIDDGRLAFRLLAGTEEPSIAGRPAPRREVDGPGQPLIVIGLGVTTVRQRLGLAFQRDATLELRGDTATLMLDAGALEILGPGQRPEVGPGQAAVQLPALVLDGALTPRATTTGARRQRGALCVAGDGAILVATSLHDSADVLALELMGEGCTQVVELDRGSKHAASVWRAGTPSDGPSDPKASTRLLGFERPMRPRTFGWEP